MESNPPSSPVPPADDAGLPRASIAPLGGTAHPFSDLPAGTAAPSLRGHGELILLVDDDATVRFVAMKILTLSGYRVLTAENGAEGIALFLLRRSDIALVISDLLMPVMDGTTMIRRLVATDPDVRIIVVSGSLGCEKVQVPEHGVLHFLEKPYTTPALLEAVRLALTAAWQPVAGR